MIMNYLWVLRRIWQLGESGSETESYRGREGVGQIWKDPHGGFGQVWQP